MIEDDSSCDMDIVNIVNPNVINNCMDGQILPEIMDSETYWIHPDHLGSSSVLTNAGLK